MGAVHCLNMKNETGGYTRLVSAVLALMTMASVSTLSQQIDLKLDPARTSVKFSLDAGLHTVHGAFQVSPGALRVDLASGQISGAILVDARAA